MANIQKLKVALTANNHPVTGAYDADAQLAADQLNALNITAEGGIDGMLRYIVENRSRTNTGTDDVATSILGRLESVAEAAVSDDVFGATGNTITMEHIHAAKMFRTLFVSSHLGSIDFANTEVIAMMDALGSGSGNAKVWKPADVTALKALSQNTQSYASDQGIGFVKPGHVEQARA